MATPRIDIPYDALASFCERHHIVRLSLFGSVLTDDFGPESDIDVLVEFAPGQTPGLAFVTLGDELAELLRREVDLSTPRCLSRYFRQQVVDRAEVLYERA